MKEKRTFRSKVPPRCKVCGDFIPVGGRSWRLKLYCGDKCKLKTVKAKLKINRPDLSPGTAGAVGELAVAVDLLSNGWAVFRALSPCSFCDLVAFKNGSIRYIEVRTGTQGLNGKIYSSKKASEYATEVATYIPETKEVHYTNL